MTVEVEMFCPQCGKEAEAFYEGYCHECCSENQDALDAHNERFDEWETLTNEQRDLRIKGAM